MSTEIKITERDREVANEANVFHSERWYPDILNTIATYRHSIEQEKQREVDLLMLNNANLIVKVKALRNALELAEKELISRGCRFVSMSGGVICCCSTCQTLTTIRAALEKGEKG